MTRESLDDRLVSFSGIRAAVLGSLMYAAPKQFLEAYADVSAACKSGDWARARRAREGLDRIVRALDPADGRRKGKAGKLAAAYRSASLRAQVLDEQLALVRERYDAGTLLESDAELVHNILHRLAQFKERAPRFMESTPFAFAERRAEYTNLAAFIAKYLPARDRWEHEKKAWTGIVRRLDETLVFLASSSLSQEYLEHLGRAEQLVKELPQPEEDAPPFVVGLYAQAGKSAAALGDAIARGGHYVAHMRTALRARAGEIGAFCAQPRSRAELDTAASSLGRYAEELECGRAKYLALGLEASWSAAQEHLTRQRVGLAKVYDHSRAASRWQAVLGHLLREAEAGCPPGAESPKAHACRLLGSARLFSALAQGEGILREDRDAVLARAGRLKELAAEYGRGIDGDTGAPARNPAMALMSPPYRELQNSCGTYRPASGF